MNTPNETPTATSPGRIASARAWKAANADHVRNYNNRRNAAIRADPERWAQKLEWNRQSARRNRAKRRAYDQSRDKAKLRARSRVRNLIYDGRLARGECEVCGKPNAHGHHDDYSKPEEVRWLCPKHHREAHL